MIRNAIVLITLSVGIQFSCSSSTKKDNQTTASTEVSKDSTGTQGGKTLPDMKLVNLNGSEFNARTLTGYKTILILFQPDCEHCQNEARQIAERLPKFAAYKLYFISSATVKDIEKFSSDYKLSGFSNINFAHTEVQSVLDSFGPIPAPSLYIYSDKGELTEKFEGEMEIDVVLKYL
jgi:peroxiredoxin